MTHDALAGAGWWNSSGYPPTTPVLLDTGDGQEAAVARFAVVVDILSVGHARAACALTDADLTDRAAVDEVDLSLLVLELRLAEAIAEQLGGDVDIALADLHVHTALTTADHAGIGERQRRQQQQSHQQSPHSSPSP